jgi:hypothetical protein
MAALPPSPFPSGFRGKLWLIRKHGAEIGLIDEMATKERRELLTDTSVTLARVLRCS